VLHGPRVDLRARAESDVDTLHSELYDDVSVHARASGTAWRPHPHGVAPPFAPKEPSEQTAEFSVVVRDGGELLGAALLWGIDTHNRSAHLGLSLRPSCRGMGYGTEAVGVLCHYGFEVLGLHRLQLETLADNVAMVRTAIACGFQLEGTRRGSSWVEGRFLDDVTYGLLADEWTLRTGGDPSPR
jgi:RimJ/RimL family protein N-acetyltransferase